jgi:hypothetical protein
MEQTNFKPYIILSTIIYLLLFPIVLWMALLWGAAADPSSICDFLILFTWFWIPASIPLSIYFAWSRYCNRKYQHIRLFSLLPLLALGAFILVNVIIEAIQNLFT